VDKPLKSVTHGQCDARPTVTFPAAEHHRPLAGTHLTDPRGMAGWVSLNKSPSKILGVCRDCQFFEYRYYLRNG